MHHRRCRPLEQSDQAPPRERHQGGLQGCFCLRRLLRLTAGRIAAEDALDNRLHLTGRERRLTPPVVLAVQLEADLGLATVARSKPAPMLEQVGVAAALMDLAAV